MRNLDRINLLEILLSSMKMDSKNPYELTYLAGTLAKVLNPSVDRPIAFTEAQVGKDVMTDLKDLYTTISLGKSWRGINPVISICNPNFEGIQDLVIDQYKSELIDKYPLVGSTLCSVDEPFGSKDECIVIGNFNSEPLMRLLRMCLNPKLKISYDIPNGFIARTLFNLSDNAADKIGKFSSQYSGVFYVARSVSRGFSIETNFYYSNEQLPEEVTKREFTFRCVSTDPKFGSVPFEVKAQITEDNKVSKLININNNKVVGFSDNKVHTRVMSVLQYASPDSSFVRLFSDSISEAKQYGSAVMNDGRGLTLNFAEVDGDVLVEDDSNGELTKISENPSDPNDLNVSAVTNPDGSLITYQDMIEYLDGNTSHPESRVEADMGIVDPEKAGLDTNDIPEGEVIVNEDEEDRQYSIISNKGFSILNTDLSTALLEASRHGSRIHTLNFSDIEDDTIIPSDDIKANLGDDHDIDYEAGLGITDAEKAGLVGEATEDLVEDLDDLKDSSEVLSKTGDKDLALHMKDAAEEVHSEAEDLEDAGVDTSVAKEFCRYCSDLSISVLTDRYFSDEEDDEDDEDDEKASELVDKVGALKEAAEILEETGDKDLAKEVISACAEVSDDAEDLEEDGEIDKDSKDLVKSACKNYSYLALDVLGVNRFFSDDEDDDVIDNDKLQDIADKATELHDQVLELKKTGDKGLAKEVRILSADLNQEAEALEAITDGEVNLDEVKDACKSYSYVSESILMDRNFSDYADVDERTFTYIRMYSEEEASDIIEKANTLQEAVDVLKETGDKDLASKIKIAAKELNDKTEEAEDVDPELDAKDVKEKCREFSMICNAYLGGDRRFSTMGNPYEVGTVENLLFSNPMGGDPMTPPAPGMVNPMDPNTQVPGMLPPGAPAQGGMPAGVPMDPNATAVQQGIPMSPVAPGMPTGMVTLPNGQMAMMAPDGSYVDPNTGAVLIPAPGAPAQGGVPAGAPMDPTAAPRQFSDIRTFSDTSSYNGGVKLFSDQGSYSNPFLTNQF